MQPETLFTKIINGDIPSHKLYEDNKTFAFLDIHPAQPGHTLVVPKTPVDRFEDLPTDDYHALMATVKKLATHLRERTGKRITVKVEGFEIPHAHIHLIPCATAEDFWVKPNLADEPDHTVLARMAEMLALEK